MWQARLVFVLSLFVFASVEAAEHHQVKLTITPHAIETHFKEIQNGIADLGFQLDTVDPVANQIFVSGPLLPRAKILAVPHVMSVELFQPIDPVSVSDENLRLYEFTMDGAPIKDADRETMIQKLFNAGYRFVTLWTTGDRFQVVGRPASQDYFKNLLVDDRILTIEEFRLPKSPPTPSPRTTSQGLRYYQIAVHSMTDDEKVELVEAILATEYRFTSHWEANGVLRLAGPAKNEDQIQALASHPKVYALFGRDTLPPEVPALFVFLDQLDDSAQVKLDFQIEKQKLATRAFGSGSLISGNVAALRELEKYFLDNVGPASQIKWLKDVIFKFGEPSLASPLALDWVVEPNDDILRDLNFRLSRYGASIRSAPGGRQSASEYVLALADSSFARAAVTRALPNDVVRIRPVEACEAALKGPAATPAELD